VGREFEFMSQASEFWPISNAIIGGMHHERSHERVAFRQGAFLGCSTLGASFAPAHSAGFTKVPAVVSITGQKGAIVQCGPSRRLLEMSLCAQILTVCTTVLVLLEMMVLNCHRCQPLQRSNRMVMATGTFLRTKKFGLLTQVVRFAFPFSGKPKCGTEIRGLTI
jgi:hypothetical protein